jgi:hypothetical protein
VPDVLPSPFGIRLPAVFFSRQNRRWCTLRTAVRRFKFCDLSSGSYEKIKHSKNIFKIIKISIVATDLQIMLQIMDVKAVKLKLKFHVS